MVSLKMMLGIVLVLGLALGWWVNSARQQAAAVALIRRDRHPDVVIYEGLEPDPANGSATPGPAKPAAWWPPAALERWLGPDFFRSVVEVDLLRGPDGEDSAELLAAASRFGRLRKLRIECEVADAQVERLARLGALDDLDMMQGNPGLTDRGMRALGSIRSLKNLRINHTAITPAGLAELGNLTRLESLHTATMTFEPDPATGRYVRAPSDVDWSPGLAALANLPRLEVLSLSFRTVDGAGLRHLGRIKSLKMLEVDGLACPDADLAALAGLAHLQVLGLGQATVTGDGFRHLGGLRELGTVILRDAPRLTDAALPALAGLPALETAMLDGSHLTVAGLLAFRAAPTLRFLQVEPAAPGDADPLTRALPGCRVENGPRGVPGALGGATGYAVDLK